MDPAAAQASQLTEPQSCSEKGEDVIPPEQRHAAEQSASFFGGEGATLEQVPFGNQSVDCSPPQFHIRGVAISLEKLIEDSDFLIYLAKPSVSGQFVIKGPATRSGTRASVSCPCRRIMSAHTPIALRSSPPPRSKVLLLTRADATQDLKRMS
jgi:hypothetical protein